MALPAPAIRNAVSHEDRIAVLLNRSGTNALNPVVGSARTISAATTGLKLKLSYPIASSSESIVGAKVEAVDSAGTVTSSSNIKSLFTIDTTNLVATATLDIGLHIASTDAGQRNLITIKSNVNGITRWAKQHIWARNMPDDAVLFDGVETDAASPLSMMVVDADVEYTVTWGVQFFPTWNDEIARQHGASATAVNSLIVKPYGGAVTVEVWDITGTPALHTAEQNIEDFTTMSLTTTGETQKDYEFRFRAKQGSVTYVVGYGSISVVDCPDVGGGGTTGASVDQPSISATTSPPPSIDTPGIPREITVIIDDMGLSGSEDVDVTITGYEGGVIDNGSLGDQACAHFSSGSQGESYSTSGTKLITLDSTLVDASLLVVEVSYGTGSDKVVGNSLVFKCDESDEGYPAIPAWSSVSYNFTTGLVYGIVTDIGFPGETVTVHAKGFTAGIESGGSAAQDKADIFAEAGEEETTTTSTTGVVSWTPTWTTTPSAIALWISNSYGSSTTIYFSDNGAADADYVKTGATISGIALNSDEDELSFSLDSNGDNFGTLTARVFAVDVSAGTILTDTDSITTKEETKTISLAAPQQGQDFYFVVLEGEQGNSNVLSYDNYVPA